MGIFTSTPGHAEAGDVQAPVSPASQFGGPNPSRKIASFPPGKPGSPASRSGQKGRRMGVPDRQAPANPLSLRLAMDRRVSGAFLRGRQRQGSPDRRAHNSSASRKLAAAPLEEGANPLRGIFAAHQLGLLGIELADRRV